MFYQVQIRIRSLSDSGFLNLVPDSDRFLCAESGSGRPEPGSGKHEPGSGKSEPGSGKPEPGSGKPEPGSATQFTRKRAKSYKRPITKTKFSQFY